MLKSARKQSADPVQEKLREAKSSWNKKVSELIKNFINVKKLINGAPNIFHKEKSSIKDPIPSDVSTIIGSIAGDFNDIIQECNSIIKQQIDYSKSRRQKQPSNQLSLPLTADSEYSLISEASNPLSRFFTYLLNPGFGSSESARIKKYRTSLLKMSADTYRNLNRLQAAIVGSTPNSIFIANQLLGKIENDWFSFTSGVATYRSSMPKEVKDDGGALSQPTSLEKLKDDKKSLPSKDFVPIKDLNDIPTSDADVSTPNKNEALIDKAKVYLLEYKDAISKKILKSTSNLDSMNLAMHKFRVASEETKAEAASVLINEWEKIKAIISSPEVLKAHDQLESVAQKFIEKMIGKTKHQLNPFDKTSAFRLDVYKAADLVKQDVMDIMDSLESGMDIEVLGTLANSASTNLAGIRELMNTLMSTVRGVGFQRPFMDLLDSKRLTNYNVNMNDKQREHLEKMLDQKRLRELANSMYGNK